MSMGLRRAAAGRPRKSLHRNDLGPNGQHPNEQRKRREGGCFFDHGTDHVLVPPLLDRTRTMFAFCSKVKRGQWVILNCGEARALLETLIESRQDFLRGFDQVSVRVLRAICPEPPAIWIGGS